MEKFNASFLPKINLISLTISSDFQIIKLQGGVSAQLNAVILAGLNLMENSNFENQFRRNPFEIYC